MIVLAGTTSYNQKTGTVNNVICPECDTSTTFTYRVLRRYTHLTFIPLFPVDTLIETQCNHCNRIFDYDNLPENILRKMQQRESQSQFRTPIWMFSGTILLIGFLAYSGYNYFIVKDLTAEWIENPIAGDVYDLKFSNGYYSTLRIDKATKDIIFSTANDYQAGMFYETGNIGKPENYTSKKERYLKTDLKKRYAEGEIISIKRK
ncbi:hypothetical protein FNO01nite_31510 [Flavobacterium noncentrifugens]|uniref:Uncharacterized protein n=1 Tax=Flavobacterium noncentrifugens TaxID=1128970 RepID=A0A1G9BJU4_9FLAO|nr:zinc-ribbon domain-containing protein [Flavobacterium noncentrifugens]GEP52479.1 hypothetical protein FNO01nite_31510 [Flavobacterium noncentrifugens]SDK39731.1 hypothetical protein SAMN04487935_3251 [Flavobacterium noncentrifugens]